MKKPKVILKCVANHYTGPEERIVEYSFGSDGKGGAYGGLILFRETSKGEFVVTLYNHSPQVKIVVGKTDQQ